MKAAHILTTALVLASFFAHAQTQPNDPMSMVDMGVDFKVISRSGNFVEIAMTANFPALPQYPDGWSKVDYFLADCSTKRVDTIGQGASAFKQTFVTVQPLLTLFYSKPNGRGTITHRMTKEEIQRLQKSYGGYLGRNGDYVLRDLADEEIVEACR